MDADEPVDAVGLQGAVNLVQGDLFWRAGEDGAPCPPLHLDDPRLFQGAEQTADHHRVAAGALRQHGAGHPHRISGLVYINQTVYRHRAFHADLHGLSLSLQ